MEIIAIMLQWLPWAAFLSRAKRVSASGIMALLVLMCDVVGAVWDDVPSESERNIKAAFLYKFLGYVEWPVNAQTRRRNSVTIGVVEANEIAAALEQLVNGRDVDGKAIEVRRLRPDEMPGDVDLLFIGRAGEQNLRRIAPVLRRQSALVVCESARILPPDCAINFVLADGRIRFEVSPRIAEDSGLKLSSRLLAVAVRVEGRKP